ncbi:MAG: winged helix-turn-helix transcriptional regulator [Candidatus Micrarchaeota archaeon]
MYELDSKDRQLLFLLDKDARRSNASIGRALRMDKASVGNRLRKLEEARVIAGYRPVVDPRALAEYGVRVYLSWRAAGRRKRRELESFFVRHPNAWWVARYSGKVDFGGAFWFQGAREFEIFWEEFVNRFQPFIREKSLSPYFGVVDAGSAFLLPQKVSERKVYRTGEADKVALSQVESQVLAALSSNARARLVDVAEAAGVSPAGALAAMARLKEKKVILGFRPSIDCQKLGYSCFKANFFLKNMTDYGKLAAYALEQPETVFINRSAGYAEFEPEFIVPRPARLREIIDGFYDEFGRSILSHDYAAVDETLLSLSIHPGKRI